MRTRILSTGCRWLTLWSRVPCSFTNNTAQTGGGGAVYAFTAQDFSLYNVTMEGNSAGTNGGGMAAVRC